MLEEFCFRSVFAMHRIEALASSQPRPAWPPEGGYAPAKSSIQGKVWEARDRAWIKLDGEGTQEADKASGGHRGPARPQRVLIRDKDLDRQAPTSDDLSQPE